MRKSILIFMAVLMTVSLVTGCKSDMPANSGTSSVSQQAAARPEKTESLNKSYEIYTNFKEYEPFTKLSVGMKLEDVEKILKNGGLVASSELRSSGKEGDRVGTYTADKTNPQASIRIQVNQADILISRSFGGVVPNGTETGFKPTNADYKAVSDKINSGSLKTITDVEAIFGKSYLSEEKYEKTTAAANSQKAEDVQRKIIRNYRWYGTDCWVEVLTDETGAFTSYKIGSVGLKD